jgi:hypothetical protein
MRVTFAKPALRDKRITHARTRSAGSLVLSESAILRFVEPGAHARMARIGKRGRAV